MPRYDLICDNCGHEMEVDHAINEPHPKKCPECKKMKLRQAWKTAPRYIDNYSPMHPRKGRGKGR